LTGRRGIVGVRAGHQKRQVVVGYTARFSFPRDGAPIKSSESFRDLGNGRDHVGCWSDRTRWMGKYCVAGIGPAWFFARDFEGKYA
jgi:hypothetical protein